jgi:hypothetical protein
MTSVLLLTKSRHPAPFIFSSGNTWDWTQGILPLDSSRKIKFWAEKNKTTTTRKNNSHKNLDSWALEESEVEMYYD